MPRRFLKLLIACILLIVLSPLLLAVAGVVRVTLGRPVLLRQLRCGQHGRQFWLYKFRSMSDERDESGELLADELRLTRAGKLIRRLSLDELPQLANVIKGDMSLVGPRPLLMEYLPLYTPQQARRLEVKPGITGWAQVNGRNAIGWEEKLAFDAWYVENRSIWLDLYILALTLLKVLRCEGISQQGHATAERFHRSGG
jgi:sugar transferase EpsL